MIDLWERTAALIRAAVYRRRGKRASASQARRTKARWPHCVRRKNITYFYTMCCNKGHNYQDGVCTVCGASENAAVPETGDGANPLLWFALLLTAAGGVLLCREVRRRFNG